MHRESPRFLEFSMDIHLLVTAAALALQSLILGESDSHSSSCYLSAFAKSPRCWPCCSSGCHLCFLRYVQPWECGPPAL